MLGSIIKVMGISFSEVKNKINGVIARFWAKTFFFIVTLWLFGAGTLFGAIGLALYIDELLGSTYKGFAIVGGIFIGLSFIFYLIYKVIWGHSCSECKY